MASSDSFARGSVGTPPVPTLRSTDASRLLITLDAYAEPSTAATRADVSRGRIKPRRKAAGTPAGPVGGVVAQFSARHPPSPLAIVRRFSAQVWKSLGDDDVMFLASGVAFNLLLAVVPFVLLLASVSILFLGSSPDGAANVALAFLDRLLPSQNWSEGGHVRETVREIARVSASVTIYSTIGFLWFSTRVFSSMRSVFQRTFDVPNERGILHGKLFDVACSFLAAIGITAYGSLSAYMLAATTRGVAVLTHLGVRESVMGPLEYAFGRLIAFLLVVLLCFAAYRLVPNRPIPSRTAWIGSITTSLLFELARIGFGVYVKAFAPSSLYTGTLATLVVVTLWTYYASLIFIIGAEVAQVVELRRHPTSTPSR